MSSAETGAGKDSAALQADGPGEATSPSPIVMMTSDGDSSAAVMTAAEGHEAGIGTATVVVDEIADPDDEREVGHIKGAGGRLQVRVSLVVERDSQKAIIIGKGGRRLKEVGVTARKGIEQLLGRKVYLDLHVRTAKDWQSDPKALARLGF